MNEDSTMKDTQKKYCADLLFTYAVQLLANQKNISYAEARTQLIQSTAFDCMFDYSTGLWQDGPAYFLWFHDLLLHPVKHPVYF